MVDSAQCRDSVTLRHVQVEQENIRLNLSENIHDFRAVSGFGNDLKIALERQ